MTFVRDHGALLRRAVTDGVATARPVHLRHGQRQIGLGSSKQPCVLAVLGLAEGGR